MTSVRDRARDRGPRDGGSVIGLPPPLKEKSPVPSPDRRGCHGPKVTRCRGNCTAACLGGGILMTKKRRRFPSGPPSAAVSQQHDMAGCSFRASALLTQLIDALALSLYLRATTFSSLTRSAGSKLPLSGSLLEFSLQLPDPTCLARGNPTERSTMEATPAPRGPRLVPPTAPSGPANWTRRRSSRDGRRQNENPAPSPAAGTRQASSDFFFLAVGWLANMEAKRGRVPEAARLVPPRPSPGRGFEHGAVLDRAVNWARKKKEI
ncbi:hypothetical protein EDB80DRAFT_806331 [Ilyonectria destructans]|nr:hypothetical protein EDB80DRAFT_806331 [Ilyonectria destructans]